MAATVNLRTFPEPHQVECPRCLKGITVYDLQGCEVVVCPKCYAYLHRNASSKYVVKGNAPAIKYTMALPLGSEGTLHAIAYKVIGCMEKKEVGTEFEWREYMLYSYSKGYAFLTEYYGNWSLVAGIQHYPDLNKVVHYEQGLLYEDNDFALFNEYSPEITGITGEYDWDVLEERIKAAEYIIPPAMLVKEENVREHRVDYYLGKYITEGEIIEAFKVPAENFPQKEDIGAIEPSPYIKRLNHVLKVTGVLVAILLLIQILFVIIRPERNLMNTNFHFAPQGGTALDSLNSAAASTYEMKSFRTPTFVVSNGPAPLDIDVTSPVDNNWFESTIELVNEANNQTWDVTKEIDYYHGYEDGESWSEGSTTGNALISSVPEGKYHLNVYPYAGTVTINEVNIKVTENEILWRNILVSLLLLSIYPIYCWYRMRKFETDRWANSDYSPYKKKSTE